MLKNYKCIGVVYFHTCLIVTSHSLAMATEESKPRPPQFGTSSFGLNVTSSNGLSSSSSTSFGMNSNSNSSSFQALALEQQSGQVAVSASTSLSNDFSATTSSEERLFSSFRQSSNNIVQQPQKAPPWLCIFGPPFRQSTFTATPKDILYNPFSWPSNNLTQEKGNEPPQKAPLPIPVKHTVEPDPQPVPLMQCTLSSGGGPSYQGKRKLQECKAIDSPILRAQMGPEIVQNIQLPNRKRVARATQSNAPNLYQNVIKRHEYSNLLEKMGKACHGIKNDPQYIKFQELSLDNQINQVITFQTLTAEELQVHWQLVYDTMSHLREYEPECEVYGYGSIITGFKSCLYSPVFHSVDLEFSVAVSPSFNHVSPEVIFNALADCAYSFLNRKKRQNTKFIKLRHNRSNLTCELSFQGRLPKHDTSMLIKYCSEVSPEIRSFFAVLRHWAIAHQIIGNAPNNLSEYNVFMLGFVYLVDERKLVQPVNELVAKDIIKKTIINSTSTTTVPNQSETGSNDNVDAGFGQVVIEMMTEFCDKYAKLDFSSVVISPYAGKVIPREWFKPGNHNKLPEALQNVKANWQDLSLASPICVQDPYVLEHNMCWDRNRGATERLKNKCLKTYNILSGKEKEDFKLLDLFMPDCQQKQEIVNTRKKRKARNCNKNGCSEPRKVESAIGIEKDLFRLAVTGKVNVNNNVAVVVQTKTKIVFSIDGEFVDLYLGSIGGSKILEELCDNLLKSKMFTLWNEFCMDFFSKMITEGLKLSVLSDPKEKVIQVTYPFWQGRAELIQYGDKNPIEIEKKQTDVIIKYFETMKQDSSGDSNEDTDSKADVFSEFVMPVVVDVVKNEAPRLEISLQVKKYN